jgi:benzodiazapine receptor
MTPEAAPLRLGALVFLLGATFLAAAAGGLAAASAPEFYHALTRPRWAPPSWLFGPVWTLLYILMAVAAWLVVRALGPGAARPALLLFLAQLVANALWTWLFFRWRLGAGAFVEILVLWVLVAATLWQFWRATPVAGLLLVPYLVWITFATALTWAMWRGNPGVL